MSLENRFLSLFIKIIDYMENNKKINNDSVKEYLSNFGLISFFLLQKPISRKKNNWIMRHLKTTLYINYILTIKKYPSYYVMVFTDMLVYEYKFISLNNYIDPFETHKNISAGLKINTNIIYLQTKDLNQTPIYSLFSISLSPVPLIDCQFAACYDIKKLRATAEIPLFPKTQKNTNTIHQNQDLNKKSIKHNTDLSIKNKSIDEIYLNLIEFNKKKNEQNNAFMIKNPKIAKIFKK